jgi:cytochrome c-type biogenesis protein CcmH
VRRTVLAIAAALLLVLAATTATATAAQAPRASVTDIEDEVMCVACGVPLAIAESPQADRERAYIRGLVKKGLTKDQIKTELVSTYSSRVLALPKDDGFGLAAYLVPIVLALLALGAGAIFLPRWRRNRDPGSLTSTGPALSDADARRLDEDLARYDL